MNEPKTFHVWLPDGRSLCDRRARLPAANYGDMSESEFTAYVDEQTASPACGPCVIIADRLRYQAAILLRFSDSVLPPTPRAAWKQLQGTRWDTVLNVSRWAGKRDDEDEDLFRGYFEHLIFSDMSEQRIERGVENFAAARTYHRVQAEAARKGNTSCNKSQSAGAEAPKKTPAKKSPTKAKAQRPTKKTPAKKPPVAKASRDKND